MKVKTKKYRILSDTLRMTCGGCPSSWEAQTTKGKEVYIRYRHGYFRVDVEGETVYGDNYLSPNGGDGVIGETEMKKLIKKNTRIKFVSTPHE
jgi:hypothetical protein